MSRRIIKSILIVVAIALVGAGAASAQCVLYERTMGGPWAGAGWGVAYVTDSIDGVAYTFQGHGLPVPQPFPVDHGWSTHGMEASLNYLADHPASSFSTIADFVATVDMKGLKAQGLSGDRRDIPLGTPYRVDFDYKATAKVFDGTGAFMGVKGSLVVRGPFWMTFVNMTFDGGATIVPVPIDGQWDFTTTGMLCGAVGWR